MPARVDVAIVGGGIMGSAVADQLRRLGFAGAVAVIERDPTFSTASTPRSAGGVRQQFSTPENISLSQVTLATIAELKAEFGGDADVSFREQGYLILAGATGRAVLEGNTKLQVAMGAGTVLLDPAGLARRFPWIATDGLAVGSFGTRAEGWVDPAALHALVRARARAAGVGQITGEVVGIERGTRVTGLTLRDGTRIECGAIVVAAGAQSGKVAALAGVALPVEPRKRYVYVFDCRIATPALHAAPLTTDVDGVWFRPEGRVFIAGLSPDEADEPAADDLDTIDHAFFDERVWPTLAARVPAFEAIKMQRAWAGWYDYNTLDQNAIIGRHPEIDNLYICSGFSGHGLQQGIGAGRAIAELIVHGRFQTIDLTRFGYDRITRGEPVLELNVF